MTTATFYTLQASPLGELLLTSNGRQLTGLHLPRGKRAGRVEAGWVRDDSVFKAATQQLEAYFAGERQGFELELEHGGTAFQERVWRELARIPFGETISYAELARRIGKPGAARAVGAANRVNPIAIITPCHRVIGADGSLTGYGGGLRVKEWLLRHEVQVLTGGACVLLAPCGG